jgi:hypothetical protein
MSPNTAPQPSITQISLLDEVMSILGRGEAALFDELAHTTWDQHATLADLTGTLRSEACHRSMRAAG